MRPISESRILLIGDAASSDEMRPPLEQAGLTVGVLALNAEPPDVVAHELIVLDAGARSRDALSLCRRLRVRNTDSFVPILYVTADSSPSARLAGLEAGADACLLRPFAPGELIAQARAFLRLKAVHDRLTEKSAEVQRVNQRLQQAYQQIDHELELARRIQRSFLPQTLPVMPPARFAVCYRPCGRVGGDFYDVFRLDEEHLGFYVADAMGHGVPASLLTIFVKKGVRAKEINGQQYRLLPPDEVLQRLNRDLIDQALADEPFVTMVYALFNVRDLTFRFARAGHPYPLYVPRDGKPEWLQVPGTLLGVFDTRYTAQARTLRPGDKIVLYTDGLEPTNDQGERTGREQLLACAATHQTLAINELLEQLAKELIGKEQPADDVTMLGIELEGP